MKQFYELNKFGGLAFYFTILLMAFYLSVNAEANSPITIRGRIIDQEEKKPLPYSTIVLYTSDSAFVAGTISDEEGKFEFLKLKSSDYKIVIKFVGYDTREVVYTGAEKRQVLQDLGDITLSASSTQLDEVTVAQRKASIENHPDKKVVNVPKSGISEGGVVTDALVQVPSITLDASRNVLLRGSTQYKVLVDGVPSPLDGNEALKGISVANVEKIEVITNPSSAYDSEGTAGIINIIMKKEKSAAGAAQISLNGTTNGSHSENLSLNGQGKKLDYNLSFDNRLQNEKSNSEITTRDNQTRLSENLLSRYDYQLSAQTFKGDASYRFDPANQLQGMLWIIGARSDQTTEDRTSENAIIVSGRKNRAVMPQLRFTHSFGTRGSTMVLFAQYSNGSEKSKQQLASSRQDLFRVNMNIPFEFLMLREDLTLILNDKLTLMSGIDYKYSGFDYRYDYFQASSSSWTKDESKSNQSSFRSDIFAGYLQLKGNFAGIGFQTGVRAENTDRILSDELNNPIFNYRKLSLFPSLHLNRSFGENTSVTAGYSRRLNRPRLFQLNPFRNYSNPGYVTFGHYALVPEFQNTLELTISQRFGKLNIQGTGYGKFAKNTVIQTSFTQRDTLFFTWENAQSDRRLGAELSVSWIPAEWMSFILSGNVYNYRLEARDVASRKENNQLETSFNLNVTPLRTLSVQSFSTLKSKSITTQGHINGYFTTDLAVSKQFFNNKLRASLKVTDLFDGVKETEVIEREGSRWQRNYKPDSRQVQLSLTFNVNNFVRKSSTIPETTPY